jgi:crotonobetainyl-CoA:carnitine CoA-transferase CaiB-like acyl-CoA transferase
MPVSRVRTPGEWMATAHAARSGAVLTVVDPVAGPLVLPGRAFDLADPAPAPGPRHLPDQDRPALLAELGRPAPARPFVAGGAVAEPLAGVRVIDISQAVAGPTAARLLADFGADVVKVGAAVPAVTDGIVGPLHRGKRTMLVDGRSAAGARLTGELLAGADVLVTNFTPRSQARYGIDDAALRPANPRLVHCSITAYGGPGPWTDRRGYENQCNAATGMSHRYGARFGWTLYQPTPINDAATGILGAFAVAVALYARGSSGPGQRVGASLAQASTLHQATLLTAEAQGQTPDAGRTEYGTSALSRLYAGSDGWFFLAARDGDLPALLAATDLAGPPASAEPSGDVPAGGAGGSARDPGPGAAGDPAGELAGRLAERFGGRPVRHWVERLGAAGIAAHRVATIDEAVEYLAGRGVVYREPGPTGADVPRPGVGRWLSETPPRVRANPGAPGSQVVELLTEHGISAAAIQELADADVVRLPDRLPAVARLT